MTMILFMLTWYGVCMTAVHTDDCDRDGSRWHIEKDDHADFDVDPVWQVH